jgi:hypothetical protein
MIQGIGAVKYRWTRVVSTPTIASDRSDEEGGVPGTGLRLRRPGGDGLQTTDKHQHIF